MAKQYLTDLDLNGVARVRGVLDPLLAQDAATKAYVDANIEGLAWKDSVRVASVANVTLATPGATVDGITMVANDRVLLKDQTTASQNGIYIWNGSAVLMTRSLDASTAAELEQAVLTVEEGTSAGATFRQTAVNLTLETTSIAFTAFGTSAPSASETTAGILEIATSAEVTTGTDDLRAVTPLKLAGWTGKILRYSANFGDGSATSFAISHNLGTKDVHVAVYRNSGNFDEVMLDIEHTSTTVITLKTAVAPSVGAYRVVIIG